MTQYVSAASIERQFGFLLQQAIPLDAQGDVPRIAVLRELNPEAPDNIYCSAVVREGAEHLASTGQRTRLFIRDAPNHWEDFGYVKAVFLDKTPSVVKKAENMSGRWDKGNHGPAVGGSQLRKGMSLGIRWCPIKRWSKR